VTAEIYVSLVGEGVDVWRPVQAEPIRGNVYRIVDQPYDRGIENWQFEHGYVVECEVIDSSDGKILAAVRATHA
jgi:hypothetical protein